MMIKNKKAQGFIFIKVIFVAIFFIIMFALALAPFMNATIGSTDLTVWGGIGEFIAGHLPLFIFITFLIAVLVALVYGFSSE